MRRLLERELGVPIGARNRKLLVLEQSGRDANKITPQYQPDEMLAGAWQAEAGLLSG